MTQKIEQIKVEFSESSLWGSVVAEDDGYDEMASEKQFAESLENHLTEQYPGVRIIVENSINDRVRVDGRTDRDEVQFVEKIIDTVWNGDDWMVFA